MKKKRSKRYWTNRYWYNDKTCRIYYTKKEALKDWLPQQIVSITITELTDK